MLALVFQVFAILFVTIGILMEFARMERSAANFMFGLALTCFFGQLTTYLPDAQNIEECILTAVMSLAFGCMGLLVTQRALGQLLWAVDRNYPKRKAGSPEENRRLLEKEI